MGLLILLRPLYVVLIMQRIIVQIAMIRAPRAIVPRWYLQNRCNIIKCVIY